MRPSVVHSIPADFAERAPSMSFQDIEREWRIGSVKAKDWLGKIGIVRLPNARSPMPDGFAAAADAMGHSELARHFGLTRSQVTRFRAELGLKKREVRPRQDIPEGFADVAAVLPAKALAERYGVSPGLVYTWRERLGISVPVRRYRRDGNLHVHSPSARSMEDQAADHLRRTAPVHRCNADGSFDHRGSHWRYGNIVLDRAAMLARAERKGWDPDAWRELKG